MIDFHTHLGRLQHGHGRLTAGQLLRFMDANGIRKAVVLPIENPEETEYYFTTDQVLAEIKGHRGRLIPFCNVDPRRTYPGRFRPEPILEEYKRKGCRGVGEILAGLPVDSPLTDRLYRACEELSLPVLLHFDDYINRDTLGLKRFEKVLRKHPRLTFVAHGPAFWREIAERVRRSEPYPTGKVVRAGRADHLLGEYANLYADLSAGSGFGALARDPEFATGFLHRHRRKLLFGTDYLHRGQKAPIVALLREAKLSPSTYRMIASGNAKRLLGL